MSATPVSSVQVRPLGTIALVSSQLALTLMVIHQFQLESRTFFNVMLLASVGFVVHALSPLDYRLFIFTLLSLASIVVALGPLDGISLIILGLVLIGISHLPVRMAVRLILLLSTGALFAAWRMELLPSPWNPVTIRSRTMIVLRVRGNTCWIRTFTSDTSKRRMSRSKPPPIISRR